MSKPFSGICCSRCWVAKSDKKRCKCRCHGKSHGATRVKEAVKDFFRGRI